MKRLHLLTILFLLLFTFACQKNLDIPLPKEAPPRKVQKAERIVEPPKPKVQQVREPKELDSFDISKIKLDDIYFDFDKSFLREDAKRALNAHGEVLKANKNITVLIEGHCDERGTEDYNMALGERRADSVKQYLISLGLANSRLKTISYGEMRPKIQGHNEEAWAQNRQAHFNFKVVRN